MTFLQGSAWRIFALLALALLVVVARNHDGGPTDGVVFAPQMLESGPQPGQMQAAAAAAMQLPMPIFRLPRRPKRTVQVVQEKEEKSKDDKGLDKEVATLPSQLRSFPSLDEQSPTSERVESPSIFTLSLHRPDSNKSCDCETINRVVNTSPDECFDFCVWRVLRREERRKKDAVLRAERKGGWAHGWDKVVKGELDWEGGLVV